MHRTVIFDVGNVILPFDPMIACRRLAPQCRLNAEDICRRIYETNLERRFEEGKIDGAAFAYGCREALGVNLSDQELRAIWVDMFVEDAEVSDIVREVKQRHPVLLLSNTNEWHWEYVMAKYPIITEIESHILSYQVGCLKPDRRIFEAAARHVDDISQTIFIDDMPHNVEGAQRFGMVGILFESARRLSEQFQQLGISTG